MKRFFVIFLPLVSASAKETKLPDVVDFNDHIQPLISEKCYHCHGPDSSTRAPKKKPLRLDREEYAFLERSNGKPTIIKGDAEASEFFKRINTTDLDDVMPPPESHKKPFDAHEVALIKKWINQGAPYQEHWSFLKPVKPAPPESDWGNNDVDKFVAAKRLEKNLDPSPPEDSARLLRRLTFDLTGLPPTPEEVSAFREMAAQDLSTAVELTVARLLTTDAYAENFARHWLDAARYADTHGIHIDNYRAIWPYRDWVIEAFRKNMPFYQFTREQIAGDLLPNASLDQKIATGFNRCMPTTGEGGAISKEYEAIYAADQVSTTSAIWLGLSTGCAACHDHKFDPISQKDFYSLTAFFRNTTMNAMDRNQAEHAPTIFAPRQEDRPRLATLGTEIAKIDKALKARRQQAKPDFRKWIESQTTGDDQENLKIESFAFTLPLTVADKQLETGKEKINFEGPTRKVATIGEVPELGNLNLQLGDFVKLNARDQVTLTGDVYLEEMAHGPLISRMDSSANYRGWDLWLDDGKLGAHFVDEWPEKAIKAVTAKPLEAKKWHHFTIIYDGKAKPNEALTIYLNFKNVALSQSHSGKIDKIETDAPLRLGGRHQGIAMKGKASLHSLKIARQKLSIESIASFDVMTKLQRFRNLPADQRDQDQENSLFNHFLVSVDPESTRLSSQRSKFLAEQKEIKARGSSTLIMEEKPGDAYAHILERGDYSLERDQVFAAIPEVFAFDQGDRKLSRKGLADWLVSDKNPLTARVTVNRMWYYFFGRGIVETTEDFGIMGAQPTHPKLLDYLATELVDSGWDLHHIIKLITTSATYQQSAKTTSANREKDSDNLYLWRGPRYRLAGEQLRDLALAAGGLLVNKVGGPPVKPYQPEGIWEAVAMKQSNTRFYKQDQGEGLYRRSLYTFWKRTAAPPSMEILNVPTREVFCVRRDRTNTPLATLVTMNDPQFVEASRALATKTLKQNQAFSQRLDFITMILMARTLSNEEQDVVRKALDHHLAYYQEKPELADQLIAVGESKTDTSIPKHELAAWTLIASQIFNLDETLTK
jgi:cytochrome c553